MPTIKITQIEALMPDSRNEITGRYIKHYTFKTFIDHTGKKTYYLNGKVVTKEYGNDRYKEIQSLGEKIKRTDTQETVSYDELIARLNRSIDPYVEYIDYPRQYRSACEFNAKIREEIRQYEKLKLDEMEVCSDAADRYCNA